MPYLVGLLLSISYRLPCGGVFLCLSARGTTRLRPHISIIPRACRCGALPPDAPRRGQQPGPLPEDTVFLHVGVCAVDGAVDAAIGSEIRYSINSLSRTLNESRAQSAHDAGVDSFLAHKLNWIVLIQRNVAKHRIDNFLSVFLESLTKHAQAKSGSCSEECVADILNGFRYDFSAYFTAQRADTAKQIRHSALAQGHQRAVAPGLLRGIPLLDRLIVSVSACTCAHYAGANQFCRIGRKPGRTRHITDCNGREHIADHLSAFKRSLAERTAAEFRADVCKVLAYLGCAELGVGSGKSIFAEKLTNTAAKLVNAGQ